jgi:hypothetical protein
MEQLGSYVTDFCEIWVFFENLSRKFLLTYSMEQSPSWEANQ